MYSKAERLHNEHNAWLSEMEVLTAEIEFLRKKMLIRAKKCDKANKKEILDKYLNKLKHLQRFVRNMREVILSHEFFIKDNLSSMLKSEDSEVDMVEHKKTERHVIEVKQNFANIKKKILNFL